LVEKRKKIALSIVALPAIESDGDHGRECARRDPQLQLVDQPAASLREGRGEQFCTASLHLEEACSQLWHGLQQTMADEEALGIASVEPLDCLSNDRAKTLRRGLVTRA
jgi:hypothetical protein